MPGVTPSQDFTLEHDIMGILATPPKATPPRNKGLLLVSLNKALLSPYFWGG